MSQVQVSDPFLFWLDSLGSDSTRRSYGQFVREFLSFVGSSPIRVLEMRRDDLVSGDLVRRKRFEGLLRQFIKSLDNRRNQYSKEGKFVGIGFKKGAYNAVREFFSFYDLGLNMRREDGPKGEVEGEVRAFRKDEIATLIEVCDVMERALVLFMKDCGVARGDIAALKLGQVGVEVKDRSDWRTWLISDNAPFSVNGVRRKTGVPFYTFVGEESVEALGHYFEFQEQGTQIYDPKGRGVPPEKIGLDSPLFRCKRSLRKLKPGNITVLMTKLINKAEIKCLPPEKLGVHSLRHFFQTTLENPDLAVPSRIIRQMMGHKVGRRDQVNETNPVYSHHGEDVRRACYVKAYPFLSVKARRIDTERLRSLEESREEDRLKIERLEKDLDIAMALLRKTIPDIDTA